MKVTGANSTVFKGNLENISIYFFLAAQLAPQYQQFQQYDCNLLVQLFVCLTFFFLQIVRVSTIGFCVIFAPTHDGSATDLIIGSG